MPFLFLRRLIPVLLAVPILATASLAASDPIPSAPPHGKLNHRPVFLEAPEELVAKFSQPGSTTTWTLLPAELPTLKEVLVKAGTDSTQLDPLFAPSRMLQQGAFQVLFPSDSMVLEMSTETRNRLYPILARHPENEFIAAPLNITTPTLQEWLEGVPMREELKVLIGKLIWKSGGGLKFSDPSILIAQSKGPEEIVQILRFMTRSRTWLVTLQVPDRKEFLKVLPYWQLPQSGGIPNPVVLSLLESQDTPISVDLIHLLPPTPRRLLYSYPEPGLSKNGRLPDCHWTSLNFGLPEPRQFLLATALAAQELDSAYLKVSPPYRYGDVLLFLQGTNGVHSCVYLADDLVFTKNGENLLAPWQLMLLDELKQTYAAQGPLVIQGYRRKP